MIKNFFIFLILFNFCFCFSQNDLCSGAISLTPTTNCVTTTGSFSGSNNTGTTTTCLSTALQDVWYSFVANDATLSITLVNQANINLGMEIFTGSCNGTSFACDNSSSSLTSEFFQSNSFTVGETYYIRVFHVGTFAISSNFTICIQNYPTPANDLCSGAISLTPNTSCVGTTGTFSGSSNTGTTTSCFASSLQDVWYSFVATDPTMSVALSNGVNLNLGMEIITGSCNGASFVCDNSSSSTVNEFYLNNNFTVGQTYYVRVFQTETSLITSSFNICVQNYPTPVNDLCSGAISLTPNISCVGITGTFSGSSNTGTTTSCFTSSLQDVWYSFVATDPTMSVTVSNGVSLNLGFEIITGSCSGASFVCDNSSSSTVNEFYLNNNFTVGQTYYVRVFQTETSLITSSFNICVQNYPTPANDLCSGAISLTPNTSCVGTTGTFSGSSNTGTSTSCFASSLQDVWYSFVATSPTMSVSLTNGVNLNLAMEIITGSCSGASFVCDNSSSSTTIEFYESNTFTIGQTYYVRVFQTETSLITSFFNICVQSPTLNIEENEINNITIYPNPVTDFIELDSNLIIKEVNLFTISGQLILSSNQKRISTLHLPEGIYLIRIEDEDGNIATKRIVKN